MMYYVPDKVAQPESHVNPDWPCHSLCRHDIKKGGGHTNTQAHTIYTLLCSCNNANRCMSICLGYPIANLMPRSPRLCVAVHKHYVSHKCCQTSTPWGPPPRPPTHRMTMCVQWLSTVRHDLRSGRKCKSVCPCMLAYQVVCLSVSMCTCVRRPALERQSVKHAHRLSIVLWAHVHGCECGCPHQP